MSNLALRPRDLGIGHLFERVWDAIIVADTHTGQAGVELYRDGHHRARRVGNPLAHVADYESVENCRFSAEVRP